MPRRAAAAGSSTRLQWMRQTRLPLSTFTATRWGAWSVRAPPSSSGGRSWHLLRPPPWPVARRRLGDCHRHHSPGRRSYSAGHRLPGGCRSSTSGRHRPLGCHPRQHPGCRARRRARDPRPWGRARRQCGAQKHPGRFKGHLCRGRGSTAARPRAGHGLPEGHLRQGRGHRVVRPLGRRCTRSCLAPSRMSALRCRRASPRASRLGRLPTPCTAVAGAARASSSSSSLAGGGEAGIAGVAAGATGAAALRLTSTLRCLRTRGPSWSAPCPLTLSARGSCGQSSSRGRRGR